MRRGGEGRGGESRWRGDREAGCNVGRKVAAAVAAEAAVQLQIYSSQLLPQRGRGRPHHKHGELESSCGGGDGEGREDGRGIKVAGSRHSTLLLPRKPVLSVT